MDVEGVTRQNVASHLQKWRLQLKRENRLDDEGNLIGPLRCSKLGSGEGLLRGSATGQHLQAGAVICSSPSSHQVCLPHVATWTLPHMDRSC